MSHVINGETVYTLEEVKVQRESASAQQTGRIAEITLDVLRDKVTNDVVNEEQALDIYNSISSAVGSTDWPTVDTIVQTWRVTVTYQYETVLEVNDVEATSEEDAIAEVRDNLSIESARLSFELSYSGEAGDSSDSHETDYSDEDIFSELEFSAEEQD